MLKIKDNIDLKDLEKFGFAKKDGLVYSYYFKDFCQGFRISICKPRNEHINREIFLDTYKDLYEVIDDYNDTIFDLIKADMVEKVVEDE